MCQVSHITLIVSKNVQIPTVSEFDEIRRGSYISREDSNGEVYFIIRDIEKFWILTEMTILPIFQKFIFSLGFTELVILVMLEWETTVYPRLWILEMFA